MAKTKYKKQYAKDLLKYFFKFVEMRENPSAWDSSEASDPTLREQSADEIYKNIPIQPATGYPTLTKFAIMKGVTIQTLGNWRKKYPEFDEACGFAEEILRDILEERALTGKWDSKTAMKIIELRAAQKKEAFEESGGVRTVITLKDDNEEQKIEIKKWVGEINEDAEY